MNERLATQFWPGQPFDPLTYTTVAVLLLMISLLASFVPARRAIIVNPLVALRNE